MSRSLVTASIVTSLLALAGCATPALPAQGPLPGQHASAAAVRFTTDSEADAQKRARLLATRPAVEKLLRDEAARTGIPSLSFGLVFHGELVYSVGVGQRTAAGGEVDADTVYRIGSITKTFTGLALLSLRDAGKIGLDDPVSRFIPEIESAKMPTSDGGPVRIRHLVTHTSGMPRLGKLNYATGHVMDEKELVNAAAQVKLDTAPGTRALYSNLAMALGGLVVGRASGEGLRSYMQHAIFDPLGMRATVWDQTSVPADKLAEGYENKDHKFVPCGPHWRMGAAEGMGGLYSSVRDLSRYVAFELSAWPPRDDAEVGPVRRSSVRESQLIAGPLRATNEGFGVNWIVKTEPKLGYVVFHNGGTEGYHSAIWMAPERATGAIGLAPGASEIDGITHKALELALAGELGPPPAPPLGGPAKVALDRIRTLFKEPSKDLVEKMFTPSFLQQAPPEKVLEIVRSVLDQAGPCKVDKPMAGDSPGSATAKLECKGGTFTLLLDAQTEPPHLIQAFLIKPPGS